MGYYEELNAFASQNPGDAYTSPNSGQQPEMPPQGDPLIEGGADPGTKAPAAPYGGLTGAPLETAMVTSAQLQALAPQRRPMRRPAPPPTPFAGLSSYLGA